MGEFGFWPDEIFTKDGDGSLSISGNKKFEDVDSSKITRALDTLQGTVDNEDEGKNKENERRNKEFNEVLEKIESAKIQNMPPYKAKLFKVFLSKFKSWELYLDKKDNSCKKSVINKTEKIKQNIDFVLKWKDNVKLLDETYNQRMAERSRELAKDLPVSDTVNRIKDNRKELESKYEEEEIVVYIVNHIETKPINYNKTKYSQILFAFQYMANTGKIPGIKWWQTEVDWKWWWQTSSILKKIKKQWNIYEDCSKHLNLVLKYWKDYEYNDKYIEKISADVRVKQDLKNTERGRKRYSGREKVYKWWNELEAEKKEKEQEYIDSVFKDPGNSEKWEKTKNIIKWKSPEVLKNMLTKEALNNLFKVFCNNKKLKIPETRAKKILNGEEYNWQNKEQKKIYEGIRASWEKYKNQRLMNNDRFVSFVLKWIGKAYIISKDIFLSQFFGVKIWKLDIDWNTFFFEDVNSESRVKYSFSPETWEIKAKKPIAYNIAKGSIEFGSDNYSETLVQIPRMEELMEGIVSDENFFPKQQYDTQKDLDNYMRDYIKNKSEELIFSKINRTNEQAYKEKQEKSVVISSITENLKTIFHFNGKEIDDKDPRFEIMKPIIYTLNEASKEDLRALDGVLKDIINKGNDEDYMKEKENIPEGELKDNNYVQYLLAKELYSANQTTEGRTNRVWDGAPLFMTFMKELMMPINAKESETEVYPKEQNKSERKLDISKLRLLNSKKTREELLKNPRYQNLEKTIETESIPINERETAQRKDDEASAKEILTKIENDAA